MKHFGLDDVSITREPVKVIRTYEGSITESDEELPFTMTTLEFPESGRGETISEIFFTERDPVNKRAAVSAIKDHF